MAVTLVFWSGRAEIGRLWYQYGFNLIANIAFIKSIWNTAAEPRKGMKKIVFAVCFVVTAATMQAQSATPESQPASTNIPGTHYPSILPDNRFLLGVKAPEHNVYKLSC